MSAEYGIFSESAGGCIYAPCYSTGETETERQRLITEDGEEADDLTVKELCPDHEEQPKDGCEECFTEEDEDD
ncbi:hypothetical protein [Streptomyces sp. S1D4-14]|uniref:hypothetical protein n=1 Tax=Streptomyces sp. S1D4-14 TaxID=2594461 RepID=UPI001162A5D8|nr:hypothetical protein [Streptomyces sp. S1D4-14]QDN64373.1 hypothetical protein FNV66_00635 [Streptomyces sp. S1D4-14]